MPNPFKYAIKNETNEEKEKRIAEERAKNPWLEEEESEEETRKNIANGYYSYLEENNISEKEAAKEAEERQNEINSFIQNLFKK